MDELMDAPETWVDRYGDYLFRFAVARVKSVATAEDLVQDTFLAALNSRKNFQGRSSVRTWLVAILRHKIVDHIRKSRREQLTDDLESGSFRIDEVFDDKGGWKILPAKWTFNRGKVYEQKEFLNVLYRCLSEMPSRLAKEVVLREMQGLSTEEICKELEISATNSWGVLFRARMSLRRCLETNGFSSKTSEAS